jgi:hypothetical protein
MSKTAIKTPHAAMIVWNYTHRLSSSDTTYDKLHATDPVMISTASIINIETIKSKSSPAGGFTVTLAPTKNWVSVLTPGSWMVLLMSQDAITASDLPQYNGQADPNKVKFLGRIESTRVSVAVDPESGARRTNYVITGTDWGDVFTTSIYVDPAARDPQSNVVGQSVRLLYENYLKTNINFQNWLTSTKNVQILKNFWGTANTSSMLRDLNEKFNKEITQYGDKKVIKATVTMRMPESLSQYFNYFGRSTPTYNIAELITVVSGCVYRPTSSKASKDNIYFDVYGTSNDGVGIIEPAKLLGQHTAWELIHDASNEVINEVMCDIRWSITKKGTLQPILALYKRVRPFTLRNHGGKATGKESDRQRARREGWNQLTKDGLVAKFWDVRTIKIPVEDVINVDAGTNWRDKLNFIEMMPDTSMAPDAYKTTGDQIKAQAQEFDENAFSREGFRPMMGTSRYVAVKDGNPNQPDPFIVRTWKYLLREWYFNTHVLLNGTITIMGQNSYIQVGDNVMFDSRIINFTPNINLDGTKATTTDDNSMFILAHVESIRHSFSVSDTGARMFRTTIEFVRGAVVNSDRRPVTDGRLDLSTDETSSNQKLNNANIFGISSSNDPNHNQLPKSEDGKP